MQSQELGEGVGADIRASSKWMEANFQSEMGFCVGRVVQRGGWRGRGGENEESRCASELIRPSRRTKARVDGTRPFITRWDQVEGTRESERRGRVGMNEPAEAIKPGGTRSKNGA